MPDTRIPLWKGRGTANAFAHHWPTIRTHLRHHWFFDSVQCAAIPLIIWWWYNSPSPGFAIGVLAVIAAVMSVHTDMRGWQRVTWILLIGAFLAIEFRAITKDRVDAALADAQKRVAENSQFLTIVRELSDSIQQNQEQFQATMSGLNTTVDRVGDSIKTQTGGDSFAYVTFTPEPNQQFMIAITSHGKYPLHEVRVTMMDEERRLQAMQEYNKHPQGNWIAAIQTGDTYFQVPYLRPQSPEGPSGDVEMLGPYPFGAKESNDLTIAFSSLNGYWNERLHLRKINGKWHQSLSVIGPTTNQSLHPFIYYDSDYPDGKVLAEKDWPRVKPQPKHP